MKQWRKRLGAVVTMAVLAIVLLMAGCDGTETRSQVDDTVEELAGKRQVDHMDAMKKDLEQIQTQQTDRIKELDETN